MAIRLWSMLLLFFLFCGFSPAVYAGNLPKVVILATGGTIAGESSSSSSSVYKAGQLKVADLLQSVPGLDRIASISTEQVCNIDSSNITEDVWIDLAGRVNAWSGKVDGIVITHGTDTMEETAWFLNLVLKTDKPVVLTGSMRPATSISADGPANLYNAVAVAAAAESRSKGVLVVMNDQIFGARDVTKTNTTGLSTFQAPNSGPLGCSVFGDIEYYRSPVRAHTSQTEFNTGSAKKMPWVAVVYGYAFNRPCLVNSLLEKGVKGIVYAGTGDGMINEKLVPALKKAREKGVAVVRSSRCGAGRVERNSMQGLDTSDGFIAADNLNPQKARILLMLGLTKSSESQKLQEMFLKY